eukprot:8394303-Pyramimonas_sp.AAC.1
MTVAPAAGAHCVYMVMTYVPGVWCWCVSLVCTSGARDSTPRACCDVWRRLCTVKMYVLGC